MALGMQNKAITINLPSEIVDLVDDSINDIQHEINRYFAIKYYIQSKITIGKAAELAGMDKVNFEIYLSKNKIPISLLSYDDIQNDLKKISALKKVKQW